ncbi:MAG: hypothetical protein KAX49_07635 [Halanaerobiales bacterium]|nr:hypothetical protein [Halanaerobiales bacterium]
MSKENIMKEETKNIKKDVCDASFLAIVFGSISFGLFYSQIHSTIVLIIFLFLIFTLIVWAIILRFNKQLNEKQVFLYRSFSGIVVSLSSLILCLTIFYLYLKMKFLLFTLILILFYVIIGVLWVIRERKSVLKEPSASNKKIAAGVGASFGLFGLFTGQMLISNLNQNGILVVLIIAAGFQAFLFELVGITFFYRMKK